MNSAAAVDVIFDGQCQFCIRTLNLIKAVDTNRIIHFHDANDVAQINAKFPVLSNADLSDAMFVVVEDEPAHRGFFAFRRLMWTSPALWMFLPLFYFPGAAFLGTRIYALVAKNRSSLGCNSNLCTMPSESRRHLIGEDHEVAKS
jgi:predicted DCC family thiol-disulfide oxidoreductase YuxK